MTQWYVEESGDQHEPSRSWLLCTQCHDVVQQEIKRADLQTPLRLSVAIGVVASDHASRQRADRLRFWDHLDDRSLERLLLGSFMAVFVVHALVFILVTAYIASTH